MYFSSSPPLPHNSINGIVITLYQEVQATRVEVTRVQLPNEMFIVGFHKDGDVEDEGEYGSPGNWPREKYWFGDLYEHNEDPLWVWGLNNGCWLVQDKSLYLECGLN